MPTIWTIITEAERKALSRFQRRKYNQDLNPPLPEPKPGVKVDLAVSAQDIKDAELAANDHRLRGED